MHEQEILLRLTEIENLLRGKQTDLLNLNQAAQYLSISHSQLYKYTSQRKIPFHKPAGKYLYFYKHELDGWIHQNDPHPNPLPEGEGTAEQNPDNEPGLFDEEIGREDKIEPP